MVLALARYLRSAELRVKDECAQCGQDSVVILMCGGSVPGVAHCLHVLPSLGFRSHFAVYGARTQSAEPFPHTCVWK